MTLPIPYSTKIAAWHAFTAAFEVARDTFPGGRLAAEIADAIGRTEQTVRQYLMHPDKTGHRTPSIATVDLVVQASEPDLSTMSDEQAWLREHWISAIDDGFVSREFLAGVSGTDIYHVRLVGIVGDLPLTRKMVTTVMQREALAIQSLARDRPSYIGRDCLYRGLPPMSVAHIGTDYIVSPGEVLEDFLDSRDLNKQDFATRCGRSAKFISEIISGKAPLTEETAIQFGRVLDTDPVMWVNLESNYRLKIAERLEPIGSQSPI